MLLEKMKEISSLISNVNSNFDKVSLGSHYILKTRVSVSARLSHFLLYPYLLHSRAR